MEALDPDHETQRERGSQSAKKLGELEANKNGNILPSACRRKCWGDRCWARLGFVVGELASSLQCPGKGLFLWHMSAAVFSHWTRSPGLSDLIKDFPASFLIGYWKET